MQKRYTRRELMRKRQIAAKKRLHDWDRANPRPRPPDDLPPRPQYPLTPWQEMMEEYEGREEVRQRYEQKRLQYRENVRRWKERMARHEGYAAYLDALHAWGEERARLRDETWVTLPGDPIYGCSCSMCTEQPESLQSRRSRVTMKEQINEMFDDEGEANEEP